MTCLARHNGEAEVWLQPTRNLGARRGYEVNTKPGPFYLRKKDPVHIVQGAGWASGPVQSHGKSHPSPGFDPLTVQPAVSHYTDDSIPVFKVQYLYH